MKNGNLPNNQEGSAGLAKVQIKNLGLLPGGSQA
jgi:hypothetical protein